MGVCFQKPHRMSYCGMLVRPEISASDSPRRNFLSWPRSLSENRFYWRLSENPHLLRYPHPSSLRRTCMYDSFLGISDALYLEIFHQSPRSSISGPGCLFAGMGAFDSYGRSLNAIFENRAPWSIRYVYGGLAGCLRNCPRLYSAARTLAARGSVGKETTCPPSSSPLETNCWFGP